MQIWKIYAKHFNRWGRRSLQLHQSNQQSRRTCQTTGTGQLALVPSVKFRPPPTDGVGVARSFLLLADRRQMKGAQSDARLRFRKRNDTKAMNEWMCRPHQIPPPSAKKERSVSRSLRPFGTRAKKNKWKKIILETMKKIQSWRSLNCSQQNHLCGQSEKWTLMDVPSSTECATIKWRCKHRTWFA